MKNRHLYQSTHPFDPHPFEAFFLGSWKAVEKLRIEDGMMTMHLVDNGYVMDDKRPFHKLRLRSRRATLNDCTCFLRPGIDVSVLYYLQKKEVSDEEHSEPNPVPVWLDAKIVSIERKPHESMCSCKFYVSLYIDQGCIGLEKIRLSKDTKVVRINQISILQKLYKQPSMGRHYRWRFSEDCCSLVKTRLTLGKFLSDLSWLLVASVMKRIAFHIRSVQSKIIYQIMADEDDECSKKSGNGSITAVNSAIENGVLVSNVVRFNPADAMEEIPDPDIKHGTKLSPYNELVHLRRSKRRNVKPDRFSGCEQNPDSNNGWVRMMPYRYTKWEVDDDADDDSEHDDSDDHDSDDDLFVPLAHLFGKKRNHSQERKPRTRVGSSKGKKEDINLQGSNELPKRVRRNFGHRDRKYELSIIPFTPEFEPVPLEQFGLNANFSTGFSRNHYLEEIDKYRNKSSQNGKKMSDLEEMESDLKWNGVQGKGNSGKTYQRRKSQCRPTVSKNGNPDEPMTYKRVSLSAGAFNKLINSYMKKIDSTMAKDEPTDVVDQWEELKKVTNCSEHKRESEESSLREEDNGETSENEMLWREMELCMASAYILEDSEVRVTNEAFQKSNGGCEHDYRLDEEIGMRCQLCGHVGTEIKHVSAPFAEHKIWTTENKLIDEDDIKTKIGHGLNEDLNISGHNPASSEIPSPEESENVWTLIPQLRIKLHLHQKRAFEFLWRNLAGSMEPALLEPEPENIGGCVISHSPGAGKTFLIIAFLASYLKLFPGKRPLVLAPKTTLYTWYKEFIKWEIPIPVHLIHGRRTYRVFKQNIQFRGLPKPSQDVMHVLDCLEKIEKWHAQPSVLVMGYSSFQTLMREDSKFAHRKYMAKVLRESPGLLILDEGHNPRSTKSRLRKALMKVDTDLRILLSGTLFQNNFCEYFNTLCLARPKFVHEVLMELDKKFKTNHGVNKAPHLLENRARKFFLDNIAKKIDSNVGDERMQGLNMLRNMTNGFIDVYEGSGSADSLPGLQIYTLLMNSTDIQHNTLVKLQKIMSTYHGYPLELELLITLASIHPWLVETSNCVRKFFDTKELVEIGKLKYDARKGSKVMFVLNLVYRVVKREKILIFCHNIAPIHLFLELFENVFQWQRGRELLTLTGDLELFERGRVIDKFEEPGGPSRVLIASITACAEGISLTAASRVIMLDSEWNPSKTKQAIARAFRPGQQKVVYVYQLLARGTLEEDKYRRTTWKEWVSSMIFSEEFVEDPSLWQAEKIEDDVLREIVEEDRVKSFHMIMKNEKASTG